MKAPKPARLVQVRAAARLAADATAGLVDLVEAVHAGIASLPGRTAPADGRTRGLTGLVYGSVRGVTRLVGGSADALLGLLAREALPGAADEPEPPALANLRAALNGVLGDHLEATANALAIPMVLRVDGRALPLQPAALAERLPQATPAVALLVHGLCMNDRHWAQPEPAMASALAAAGYTPLQLHYNSGRPIARNGADLAALLDQLLEAWPVPLQRLVIVGHSMGGLVARSAWHQALNAGPPPRRWTSVASDLVCLGSPHQGAPLERVGHVIDRVLAATPYARPFARLGRLRSAGITDLRHGQVLHPAADRAPLPAGVRCFAVAGHLGASDAGRLRRQVLGDGLVPLDSAFGRHAEPARTLGFEPAHQHVAAGVGHLALMGDAGVVARVVAWLGAAAQSATAAR
jgi:hypothetical protein